MTYNTKFGIIIVVIMLAIVLGTTLYLRYKVGIPWRWEQPTEQTK